MPIRLIFLCVLPLVLSTSAFAQNVNDFVNLFGGMMQQAMRPAAQSEWRRLPPPELSCLDQALREQGASIDALINRGVMPSDPRLAQVRSDCRGQLAQGPEPDGAQSSPYVVDGLALGGQVRFESEAYKQYHCTPSDKFPGFTWCHKEKTEKTKRGEVTSSNSILHSQDGTALYVNRYIEPAFFGPNEVQTEIDRLSAKFSERAREFRMPGREGLPKAIIAVWGKIELEQLDAGDVATVASGGTVKGLLVSYLGDLQRSAKSGVPVYQLAGGAGFLWAATFNQDGRGVLRFLTIDASQIASPIVAQNPPAQPPQAQTPQPVAPPSPPISAPPSPQLAASPAETNWLENFISAKGGCGQIRVWFGQGLVNVRINVFRGDVNADMFGRPARGWTDDDIATAARIYRDCETKIRADFIDNCVRGGHDQRACDRGNPDYSLTQAQMEDRLRDIIVTARKLDDQRKIQEAARIEAEKLQAQRTRERLEEEAGRKQEQLREQAQRDKEATEEARRAAESEAPKIAEATKEAEEARRARQEAEQRLAEIRSRIEAQGRAADQSYEHDKSRSQTAAPQPDSQTAPALADDWTTWATKDIAQTSEAARLYDQACYPIPDPPGVHITHVPGTLSTNGRLLVTQMFLKVEERIRQAERPAREAVINERDTGEQLARSQLLELGRDKWCATVAPYITRYFAIQEDPLKDAVKPDKAQQTINDCERDAACWVRHYPEVPSWCLHALFDRGELQALSVMEVNAVDQTPREIRWADNQAWPVFTFNGRYPKRAQPLRCNDPFLAGCSIPPLVMVEYSCTYDPLAQQVVGVTLLSNSEPVRVPSPTLKDFLPRGAHGAPAALDLSELAAVALTYDQQCGGLGQQSRLVLNKLLTTVDRNDIQAKMQDVHQRLELNSRAVFCTNLAATLGE